MFRKILLISLFVLIGEIFVNGCLITNCPRGGKRNGKFGMVERNIKPCLSCGPGHAGQCFGPNICCGTFGCLIGTPETLRCQREGLFHEREPCIAGNSPCRKKYRKMRHGGSLLYTRYKTLHSCHVDKQCITEEKNKPFSEVVGLDLYSLMNNYGMESALEK
ncbi:hypothetical protein NQ318_022313 [Aromia moschata]|uniref:Uncharacterized protein n=1 Tax=Aromia moschata TaxID=1265417 RepID=A0AAV8Z6M2_9CUCU|nr:hypothetical protein NQ318_022313 [Aromia moschata]